MALKACTKEPITDKVVIVPDSQVSTSEGARGYYLSNSWISSSGAFGLFFDSVSAKLTEFERCKGFSVRPVSD